MMERYYNKSFSVGGLIINLNYFIIVFLISGFTLVSKNFSKLNIPVYTFPLYITEIAIFIIVFLYLFKIFLVNNGRLYLNNPLKIEFILFYIIFLISLSVGLSLYKDTIYVLRQSALFYYSIFYFLIILTLENTDILTKLKYIFVPFFLASNLVLLFFILRFLKVKAPFEGLGDPGYIYVSILLIIELTYFIHIKNKFFRIIIFINILLLLIATILYNCRGNWIATLVAILSIYIFFKIVPGLRREIIVQNMMIFLVIVVTFIIISFLLIYKTNLFAVTREKILSFYQAMFRDTRFLISIQNIPAINTKWRFITWKEMFVDVLKSPFLGFGFGKKFISQYTLLLGWTTGLREGWVESHNYILSFLYRSGFLGLGAFLFIIGSFFKKTIGFLKICEDKKVKVILISLLSCIVYILVLGLFEVVLEVPYSSSFFWIIMGLTVVIMNSYRNSKNKFNLNV